jgi:hypothetical protein
MAPSAITGQSPATGDSGEIGRDSPFGKIPLNEKKARRTPAQSRPERNVTPAAAGEEVDRRGEEGQEAAEQDELDRPAADEPRARPHVRVGAARHLGRRVERSEKGLGRAPELVEMLLVEGGQGVPLRTGRAGP